MCLVDPLSVFLIVQITAFKSMQDNWKRKNCYSVIVSQLGFYYPLTDKFKIMRRGKDLLFSYRLSAGSLLSVYRPMQDNGGV